MKTQKYNVSVLYGYRLSNSPSWVLRNVRERIQQLGGIPVFQPEEIAAKAAAEHVQPQQGATLAEMVMENFVLKRYQIAVYTAFIRELGAKDLTTRHLLMGFLAETERQASELANYLKRSADTRP